MTRIETTDDVRAALAEVADWMAPAPLEADLGSDVDPGPEAELDDGRRRSGQPTRGRNRLVLVAAVIACAAGLAAGFRLLASEVTVPAEPANLLAPGLEAGVARELCVDAGASSLAHLGHDADRLRADGVVHSLDRPAVTVESGREVEVVLLIVAAGEDHLGCALTRRSTDPSWRPTTVVADQQPGSIDARAVDLRLSWQIDADQVFVTGRAGSSVVEVTVSGPPAAGSGEGRWSVPAEIDDGWWLAVAPGPPPGHRVRWVTDGGAVVEATETELQDPSFASLCGADPTCLAGELDRLRAEAASLDDPLQAEVLADGTIAEDELRAVMHDWGTCVGEESGAEIGLLDDEPYFVATGGADREGAFERCKGASIALVIEAMALLEQP